jgi:hypothetical protein
MISKNKKPHQAAATVGLRFRLSSRGLFLLRMEWTVPTMATLAPIPIAPKARHLNGGNTKKFHNNLFNLNGNISNDFVFVKHFFGRIWQENLAIF